MLLWRVITAIILIPLVLGLIIQSNTFLFSLVSAAFFALGAWEWANLCHFPAKWQKGAYVVLFLLAIGISLHLPTLLVLTIGSLFWLGPLYWVLTFKGTPSALWQKKSFMAVVGLIPLTTAWYALIDLHRQPFGAQWIILLLLIVWAADTFAYFVGRQLGTQALSPLISPKKTYEGFWGGLIGALGTALLSFGFMQWPGFAQTKAPLLNAAFLPLWLILALMIFLWSVLGDLFESFIKRLAKVKDSGTLLPGHGGVLDRIDSLLAALPFYALVLSCFNRLA